MAHTCRPKESLGRAKQAMYKLADQTVLASHSFENSRAMPGMGLPLDSSKHDSQVVHTCRLRNSLGHAKMVASKMSASVCSGIAKVSDQQTHARHGSATR